MTPFQRKIHSLYANDDETHPDIKDYKKVSGQLGSNPAGVYEHKGEKYYIKHSHSNEHAHNEVLASKLYKLAGSPVVDQNLIHTGKGKLGTISKMEHLTPMNEDSAKDKKDIHKHLGTHAWLSNWDTVGLEYDNQARDKHGKMKTIDVGGSLLYRAQGGPKGKFFGDHPSEMKTLKNRDMNPQASHVFKSIKPEDEKESIDRVKNISDKDIHSTIDKYAHPDHKEFLKHTLVARKNNL